MNKTKFGLTAAHLRILALFLMLLDHLWGTVVPGNAWMTYVGRMAFPIFAFQAAEGYHHTHDFKGYCKRLAIFALVSEIPFNLMISGSPIFPFHQNVMLTLLFGLLACRASDLRAEGKSLDEVAAIAQRYADNMASITVKSTDATHPQNGASFGDLGETDLMEVGAGQHGEGGGIRMPMMSSKETVALVAEPLCKKLGLTAGDKAFVMVNGCGATTMMEMLVLFKDTVEFLNAKGVEVVGNMVGEILTVQEAAGFQLNIAKGDAETLELWNTPCHTPAYSKV